MLADWIIPGDAKVAVPFDVPESIRELALRPLIPKLLRLCPFPPRSCLISLFRRMTGVSATGNAIFVPLSWRSLSGDSKLAWFVGCDLEGRPLFGVCDGGSSLRFRLTRFPVCGSKESLPERRLEGFPLDVLSSPTDALAAWAFGGRPLFDCGLVALSAVLSFVEVTSDPSFGFFGAAARVNLNPSSSSSYTAG